MHIKGMTVGPSSHPAFRADLSIIFDEKVNVFIGPNAAGKSSFLRVLAYRGFVDKTAIFPFPPVSVETSPDWAAKLGSDTGLDDSSLWGVPWIYIPATRISLPSELEWADDVQGGEEVAGDAEDIHWQDNARIFDGRWVERACKKLFDRLKERLNDEQENEFYGFLRAVRTTYNCSKTISAELVTGRPTNYVSHPYELLADPRDFEPLFAEPYVHPGMGVYTKAAPNSRPKQQYAGDLSAGTQITYLWILYVALKIWYYYRRPQIRRPQIERPRKGDFTNQPAILLIDEIENHLHPTWQRRVIPALLEHFPGLQIFATTHSPFVVAGLKAGQVHLLNRDENGVVTTTTNTEDIIGWTADEILRTMMGVDDPTDDATAASASELRQLRSEGPRDTVEAEEQRQQRMAELRENVDRNLLAGGPWKAQRELFEQQFDQALEQYRLSKSLDQENG